MREAVAWSYLIGLLALLTVIAVVGVLSLMYIRRIFNRNEQTAKKIESHLDFVALHGVMSDADGEEKTQRIIAAGANLPEQTALKVLEIIAEAHPPNSPHGPALPGLAFGLSLFLSAATVAALPGPLASEVHAMDGLTALRAGDDVAAEKAFAVSGDQHRLAESLINQGRIDEAQLICERLDDGQGKFLLGLIHRLHGDEEWATRCFREAAALGNEPARNVPGLTR